jgi:hypothetical protein
MTFIVEYLAAQPERLREVATLHYGYSSADTLMSMLEQLHDGSLPGHSRFPSRLAPCANPYFRPFKAR